MNRVCAPPLVVAAILALAACHPSNTAPGNDREARSAPAETAAGRSTAAKMVGNVGAEAIQPEPMSDTDVASIGGLQGRCAFHLTRVDVPALVYGPDAASLKLNGKLLTLPRVAEGRYADAGLQVSVSAAVEPASGQGLRDATLIVLPPGATGERGYRGFAGCGAIAISR